MKRTLLACWLLVLSAVSAYAQAANVGPAVTTPPSPQKAVLQTPAPLTTPKPVDMLLGKSVFHQGYFMDLVRAQPKRALFDLRTPLDADIDLENLVFSPDTGHIQAVVLFRIKF